MLLVLMDLLKVCRLPDKIFNLAATDYIIKFHVITKFQSVFSVKAYCMVCYGGK